MSPFCQWGCTVTTWEGRETENIWTYKTTHRRTFCILPRSQAGNTGQYQEVRLIRKNHKYTPENVYIAGKTGTYRGANESQETIQHKKLNTRNHVVVLNVNDKYYSLSVLSNTGRGEDVAILGGGLMREFISLDNP